ncbi:hypothetical protein [Nocardioides mesophilus]|uniref:PQQ-binding-like beta-propeller repeat protein n=1 Tax=Nocardioides mesophilus TaxID=433659 RepID=A0A7G9RDR8_9ACTN|nr:hypothetical protein [Nocardioides mesophilus]QNN53743.1 hypothetical protein H9L09_04835 [Nocardioides mesophilus]
MVNDLRELLRDNVASPPHDHLDLGAVVTGGRRRVRRRRLVALGGTALATAAVVMVGPLASLGGPPDFAAAGVPQPDAPTLRLADADAAAPGKDYRVLASYTNDNLDRDNGQYFDGVTDDGLILFRDGPRMDQLRPRFALLDPATGKKDWLPDLDIGQTQTWPLDLGKDRLRLLAAQGDTQVGLVVYTFDRERRQWTETKWPGLPAVENPFGAVLGPDDRIYVPVPNTQGQPPEGGWPTGPDGEADDADAEGSTYRLWSASLTDPSDVRDEGLIVGSVAFTDHSMVWTDSSNGASGRVHVRDLETGAEHAFDPRSGNKCNLLSFGATDDRIVMGQYCGTYDDGVRDDRVQVLDSEGHQVVTLQGSDVEGALTSDAGAGLLTVTSRQPDSAGTYLYDLDSGRFLRISDGVSSWTTSGPTPEGQFLWNTPENRGRGMTQHLGELVD